MSDHYIAQEDNRKLNAIHWSNFLGGKYKYGIRLKISLFPDLYSDPTDDYDALNELYSRLTEEIVGS